MVILLMDLYIVIWLMDVCWLYGYIVIWWAIYCYMVILLVGLYIVIWLYCWWTYILLYGYIVNGPIYCYMVILLVDLYIVIWLYCW